MKWVISTAIDITKANSFLSRMDKYMGNPIINIERERLYREGSSQELGGKTGIPDTEVLKKARMKAYTLY